ncbi:hypothetical protein MSAN_00056900 [Mycena sanguinolenta]|uniref:DUF6593 domain-containing protein n=1 Tax=Mycena sanguinolenta TaxID=230812 RepID=A0A8H6ZFH8_9AGAR|nr:hypothetical protein MSAN_00056900 [Mycena sanguinolenta]
MSTDDTPSKSIVLELATNSVRNNTFAAAEDDPYFEVVTRFWHPNITKINKLDPNTAVMTTVCEIDKKEAKIRFLKQDEKEKYPQDSPIGLGEWLSIETMLKLAPEKPGGIFVDSDGVEYRWKTHNRNFQLIRCGDVGRLPIVLYYPCKRHFGVWRMSKHATLEIKPQIIKSLERLIASYLLVERQRRHHIF